jgi:hypothetical protein
MLDTLTTPISHFSIESLHSSHFSQRQLHLPWLCTKEVVILCRRAEPDPSRIPKMIAVSNAMDRNMLYAMKVPRIPRDNDEDRQ